MRFSHERELLGTGGGIRRVADFLRESDPCLIIGGDMLAQADLGELVARHRARGDAVTMLLREDPRIGSFGSVGVDAAGAVRRIATRHDLGGETRAGLYTWVNVVSRRALDALPDREAFSHFQAWIAPMLPEGGIRGELDLPSVWEPVGTLPEYLAANLDPPQLDYLDPAALAARTGARLEADLVIGAGATIGAGASLRRVVVWDGEHVPDGLHACDGIFAGGVFHPVERGPA